MTTATGKLPAKAQLDKAAELAKAATKIVELMGPENVRQLAAQMRRAEAAARAAQNAEPQVHVRTLPIPPLRRGHVGGPAARPGARRTRSSTRAGPQSSDPDLADEPPGHWPARCRRVA